MQRQEPGPGEEAVSPIIGTMLLVAIVVTLAAVTYLLTVQLSGQQEPAPAVGFMPNQGNGELKVIRSETGLQASRLAVSMSSPGHASLGTTTASLATTAVPAGQFVTLASGTASLEAGDRFTFCLDGARGPATVQVRDQASNTLLFTAPFLDLPACS